MIYFVGIFKSITIFLGSLAMLHFMAPTFDNYRNKYMQLEVEQSVQKVLEKKKKKKGYEKSS